MTETLSLPTSFHPTTTGLKVDEDVTFEEWEACGVALSAIEGAVQWWIGDWLNFGEAAYGEKYAQAVSPSQARTWQDYAWVSGRIQITCRHVISYTHHALVARFSDDPSVHKKWLDWCETPDENGKLLTASELRIALRAERQQQQLAAQSWPTGQYRVIYCDPPWKPDVGLLDPTREIENQYPTLSQVDADGPCRDWSGYARGMGQDGTSRSGRSYRGNSRCVCFRTRRSPDAIGPEDRLILWIHILFYQDDGKFYTY